MTTSEQVNEIAAALAKAQAGMKNATLNKVNPHFKSKFADLAEVRNTVIPDLTRNGIAVVQTLDGEALLTRLLHTSGQWIESRCPILNGGDMQKMGSAITYARRYSLSAICGIAADEDDDANAAVKVEAPPDGYAEFAVDFLMVAEEGLDALRAAFKSAKEKQPAYVDYLTKHDNARYEKAKARASEITKSATVA